MKKIDINKIDESITDKHLKYCENLRPETVKINGKDTKKKLEKDDDIKLLCCEYPFDFNKPENNYLTDKHYAFYKKNNSSYNGRVIDYTGQYERFRSEIKDDWGGVKLIEKLNVTICPYCGMNYISSVTKKNKEIKTEATLDHYLPQDEYPFLAMNIYNLVPSCRNCNSIFKFNEEDAVVYPFEEALEDLITFYIKNEDIVIDMVLNGKTDIPANIEIFTNKSIERLKNHIKILALEERYNNFQNIAKSLILKKHLYNNDYLKSLGTLGILSKTQFVNALLKQDMLSSDEIFSKFKQDIWKQLSTKHSF